MPTYKNESGTVREVLNIHGNLDYIRQGETVETEDFISYNGYVKISDEPLYNPIVAHSSIVSTGIGDDQELDVSDGTKYIKIWEITGGPVTFFWHALGNVPGLELDKNQECIFELKDRAEKLIFQFASTGSCSVLKSKIKLA